jgi:hypothetical protein
VRNLVGGVPVHPVIVDRHRDSVAKGKRRQGQRPGGFPEKTEAMMGG